MAVYTKLEDEDFKQLLLSYHIGQFQKATPIAEGIENTNYLLETSSGKFILTVFENRVENFELPFFFELTSHLREGGINCPLGIQDGSGKILQDIKGKKAAVIEFLEGRPVENIDENVAGELGENLAKMHLAVSGFKESRLNPIALSKWTSLFEKVAPKADEIEPGLQNLIEKELYHLAQAWPFGLPAGVIHADLFPDNVFFQNGKLSGIIDFYFACNDFFAYDVAICINAWDMQNSPALQNAFLSAYQNIRPLGGEELEHMQTFLRGAALRFLLTRIYDWFNTPEDAFVNRKDPQEYLNKLKYWQTNNLSIAIS